MKLVQCERGHFYDSERWPYCPHCAEKAGGPEGYGKSMETFKGSLNPEINRGMNTGIKVTEASLRGTANNPDNNAAVSFFPGDPGVSHASKQTAQSLRKDFQQTENRTVGYLADKSGRQPVVGWLVCTEGKNYGRSFPLHEGKNFIGRNESMDVALTDDETVSRIKHAVIVYEPKQRKFFAQPGESHELFYVNDDVVLTGVQLHDRDVLSIGDAELVFVQFCDERFGWEQKQDSSAGNKSEVEK